MARWQVDARYPLLWRFWDGQYLVYHTGSGDTHALDVIAGEVLKAVEQRPGVDVQTVTRQIAAVLDLDADRTLVLRVQHLLNELEDRSLIEPVRNL